MGTLKTFFINYFKKKFIQLLLEIFLKKERKKNC